MAPAIELSLRGRHWLEVRLRRDNLEFDRGEGKSDRRLLNLASVHLGVRVGLW